MNALNKDLTLTETLTELGYSHRKGPNANSGQHLIYKGDPEREQIVFHGDAAEVWEWLKQGPRLITAKELADLPDGSNGKPSWENAHWDESRYTSPVMKAAIVPYTFYLSHRNEGGLSMEWEGRYYVA